MVITVYFSDKNSLKIYIANNMGQDQVDPLGAVWSWLKKFASVIKLVWSVLKQSDHGYYSLLER